MLETVQFQNQTSIAVTFASDISFFASISAAALNARQRLKFLPDPITILQVSLARNCETNQNDKNDLIWWFLLVVSYFILCSTGFPVTNMMDGYSRPEVMMELEVKTKKFRNIKPSFDSKYVDVAMNDVSRTTVRTHKKKISAGESVVREYGCVYTQECLLH